MNSSRRLKEETMGGIDVYRHPEKYRYEPFHIFGELYYVGDAAVCEYLLDTGDGLIAIDTGYPMSQALLVDSIYRLGFDPRNIRMILHTHGHFDHYGCTNFLKAVSGAETYLCRHDAKMFRERPELTETDMMGPYGYAELFVPDHELADGDVLSLGSVRIKALETPGHTEGVLTYLIELHENGQTKTAALFGGIGRNTMRKEYEIRRKGVSVRKYREDFQRSLDKLRKLEQVDITLANHPNQGPFISNHEMKRGFVHPEQWQEFLDYCQARIDELWQEEPEV